MMMNNNSENIPVLNDTLDKISEMNNEINNQKESLKMKEECIQGSIKQALSEMVEVIRKLESQITEKNVQLETLEKNLYVADETIRDVKNKFEESCSNVADLEAKLADKQEEMNRKIEELKSENERELENKANKYNMEIETSRKQTTEVQSELTGLKKSIQSDYVTLKDYNQTVAEMQAVLDEIKHNVSVQLNNIREEINSDAKAKEELIEDFNLREKDLEGKAASLLQETTRFSEEVAESKKKIEELQEKNESLEKDNEKKTNEIEQYLDEMSQMRETVQSSRAILEQLQEFPSVKKENAELKVCHKKREEKIKYLQKVFTDYSRKQDYEMSRIKKLCKMLQQECGDIKSDNKTKEEEILRSKKSTRLALQENYYLLVEIKRLNDQSDLKRTKKKLEKKINMIYNEKMAILSLVGQNNPNQTSQFLKGAMDVFEKHMTENTTLQSNLNEFFVQNEQPQKQAEEFANQHNIDPSKLGKYLNQDPDILLELNKLKIENHNLKDVIFRVNSLLTEGFIHLKSFPKPCSNSSDDFNATLEHARDLVGIIKNKEKDITEKENNETRNLDIQLFDLHSEDIRQNYSFAPNDPEFKAVLQQHSPIVYVEPKNVENKENTNDNNVQRRKRKIKEILKIKEINLSKILAPTSLSGVRRCIDSILSSSTDKESSLSGRSGENLGSENSHPKKNSAEKTSTIPLKQYNSITDITNQELDRDFVTKKLKKETVPQNNNSSEHSQIENS